MTYLAAQQPQPHRALSVHTGEIKADDIPQDQYPYGLNPYKYYIETDISLYQHISYLFYIFFIFEL